MSTKFRDWIDDQLTALSGANVDVDNDKIHIVDDSADASKYITPKELVANSKSFLQSGSGAVARTVQEKNRDTVSIKDFGAVCDDSTDDSASIQKAIDYAGSVAGRRSGIDILLNGKCAIGSTLLVRQKSIQLKGLGWGNQGQADPNSYLRWIGAAGSPMLRVQDTAGGFRARDLRFIGNPTNKPSGAISLYQTTTQANSFHEFQNITIGEALGGESFTTIGLTNGILIEGSSNQNNAECLWQNIKIANCDEAGIRNNGIQMGEHTFVRTTINGCLYGVRAVVGMHFFGLGITNSSGSDFFVPFFDEFSTAAFPRILVKGYFSEGSARLIDAEGSCWITIEGGSYQIGSFTNSDGKWINCINNTNSRVILRDFTVPQVSSPSTTPFIFIRSNSGAVGSKHLVLDGIEGLPQGGPNSNGIDITCQSATDNPYVYFREIQTNGVQVTPRNGHQHLIGFSGINFDPSRNDISSSRTSPGMQHDSPAQITANQNDYNPSAAGIWRLSTDASRNITGIVPRFPGRQLIIINAGAQDIVLQNQNAGSAVANRIITGTGADVTVAPDDTVTLWYDQTTTRWRILNTH